jgi:hypothetical protein
MGQRPAGTAQANECSVTVMSFQAQIDQSLLVGSMAISSARPTLGSDQLATSSNSFTATAYPQRLLNVPACGVRKCSVEEFRFKFGVVDKLQNPGIFHALISLPDAAKDLIEPGSHFFDQVFDVGLKVAIEDQSRCRSSFQGKSLVKPRE